MITVDVARRLGWEIVTWGGGELSGILATYHVTPASWGAASRSTSPGDVFSSMAGALASVAARTAEALGISLEDLEHHLEICS